METVRLVANIPLFEDLPEDQLKDLASIALAKSFKRGRTIFSEGETGDRILRGCGRPSENLQTFR